MATRAQVETILIARAGAVMTLAGMDGTTVDGTNTDLNDPIAWAVRVLGGSVANPASVTSAEVAAIASDDLDDMLDLAEYRLLKNIITNLTLVDLRVGPREEKFNQLFERLESRIAQFEDELADLLMNPLQTGIIQHDFAEHIDTTGD